MVCVLEVGIGSSCLSVVWYTTVGEILLCNRGVVESTYIRTFDGILRCLGSNYSSIGVMLIGLNNSSFCWI